MFGIFKKKAAAQNLKDRELIENNAGAIDALIVLAYNDEIKAKFKALKERVKYIIPLVEEKAYSMDKKISALIGDIKIELSKYNGDEKGTVKINNLVKELEVLVAERKALA